MEIFNEASYVDLSKEAYEVYSYQTVSKVLDIHEDKLVQWIWRHIIYTTLPAEWRPTPAPNCGVNKFDYIYVEEECIVKGNLPRWLSAFSNDSKYPRLNSFYFFQRNDLYGIELANRFMKLEWESTAVEAYTRWCSAEIPAEINWNFHIDIHFDYATLFAAADVKVNIDDVLVYVDTKLLSYNQNCYRIIRNRY